MTETAPSLRPAAEARYAQELATLREADADGNATLPPGWRLSARAVRAFIIGDERLGISRKFYGDDPLVDRAIVALLGRQGLMLVGEPGTAKSMLSELLAAAISGTSGLTVQGTAGTTEDHVRYSWNYALLISDGPSLRALVPSPIFRAMQTGRVARFEEVTRCAPEVQDSLVSILSDKVLMVPELGEESTVMARPGFNVIGTANLRDRGVNEMSAALKRRFAFETVRPISDPAFERELVRIEVAAALGTPPEGDAPIDDEVLALLVTVFQELRSGETAAGTPLRRLATVMSTAEAVNTAIAASLEARYLGDGRAGAAEIARAMIGVAQKDDDEDTQRMKSYVDTVLRERARDSRTWKTFFSAAEELWG